MRHADLLITITEEMAGKLKQISYLVPHSGVG